MATPCRGDTPSPPPGCECSRNLVSNFCPSRGLNPGPRSLMAAKVTTRLLRTPKLVNSKRCYRNISGMNERTCCERLTWKDWMTIQIRLCVSQICLCVSHQIQKPPSSWPKRWTSTLWQDSWSSTSENCLRPSSQTLPTQVLSRAWVGDVI